MEFPVYRKRINNKNFYKILSEDEFIELQIIGKKINIYKVKAKIYPDFLLIKDLINISELNLVRIESIEFDSILKDSNL
jgi:hypothetical protein